MSPPPLLGCSVALTLLLLSSQLASGKKGPGKPSCAFNASTDLNATTLYLEASGTRFRYPDAAGQLSLGDKDKEAPGLRIACPAGSIVLGARPTNLTSSLLECVGGPTVKLTGTFLFSPLKQIGCDVKAEPTLRLTSRTAGDGKRIVEVGYALAKDEFLPVIEDLAVNSWSGGFIPRWAHFKALPVKSTVAAGKAALRPSPLAPKVNFAAVYDAAKQRNSFASLFNDTALVDKYLPADGTHSFVASQLVSQDDLYYESQRSAASYYETTVPVWKSVETGNWRRVGEAVRRFAAESPTGDVDIWSGSYLSLWLRDARNKTTYVNLPRGLKPAQFLFKYVHQASANKGIVFVTVNNPHLTAADDRNVICEEVAACAKEHPEFGNLAKGYTYCCSLKGFESHAKRLGLPLFADASQLFA
ncbi:uncharacterized protein LOC131667267 [Phymastichus coffea]|uniref:uncharacterized protein LOC131667267 n=1 Tax=Phymastichus coffea TaxID=108790 RepID=UPI00273A8BA9|nr:uncharacterized protein LOC131667267 [Phymastichus coffea]